MKKKGLLAVIILVVVALIFGGLYVTRNLGKSTKSVGSEDAMRRLNKYVDKIEPGTGTPTKSTVEYAEGDTTLQELPELSDSGIAVRENTQLYAEIFASSEKTGTGTDGWLREMTQAYACLANSGVTSKARTYTTVTDSMGNIVLSNGEEHSVLYTESTAFMITRLMQTVVTGPYGTARRYCTFFNKYEPKP